MTRLILWRHGQTEWNAAGRRQGQTDVDLDAVGRAQAATAAVQLAALRPDLIVSSDLRRAYDTALALGRLVDREVQIDKRLRERGYGDWEGLTRSETAERYPDAWAHWVAGQPVVGHGIEPYEDVAHRMMAAINDTVTDSTEVVVVVTHGGAALRVLEGLVDIPHFATGLSALGNCRWAELRRRGDQGSRWRLHEYNVGSA